MTPFDYVKDASFDKKNLMRGEDATEEGYDSWIVNLAFSYHSDTILHANLMNMYPDMPARAQYEFYLNSTRRRKRFSKWAKKEKDDANLDLVCSTFGVNKIVGKEYLRLLTDEQLHIMEKQQYKGGDKR